MTTLAPPPPVRRARHQHVELTYQPGIDGLRAVSVLAVIAYHAGWNTFEGGFLGVEVFFAISGYLITSLLAAEYRRGHSISLRSFWGRRARRLLPALYVLLLFVIVASFVSATDYLGRLRGDVAAAFFYVSNWWQVFSKDSYFVQAGRPPMLSHLWSLAVEEQFYLLFPIVALACFKRFRRGRIITGFIVVALASSALMALLHEPYHDATRVYVGTDTRLSGLLLGAALALWWSPTRLRRDATNRVAATVLDALGVGGLIVLLVCFVRINEFDPFVYRGGFLLVDVATLLVVAVVVHPAARLGAVLGWEPLRYLGTRSYGLYLWHWPIFQLTRPDLDLSLPGWLITAIRLLALVVCTELSYRFVEAPFRRGALGRWWDQLRGEQTTPRRRFTELGLAAAIPLLVVGLLAAAPSQASATRSTNVEVALDVTLPPTTAVVATTTTTVAPTVTPVDPAASVAPTTAAPATAPPPPAPPTTLPSSITAIGDSVMAGAAASMRRSIPGIVVDAVKSRQFNDAINQAMGLANFGVLGAVAVVHLGTNGPFSDAQFDHLVDVLGFRTIYFVNTRVPRPWQDIVNSRIASGAARHPNVRVIDWYGASGGHPEYFVEDGTHLTPDGIRAYVTLLLQNLAR